MDTVFLDNFMKYTVYIQFERKQAIEVEANTPDEAQELVEDGEFTDEQITGTDDNYVEIVAVVPTDSKVTL